MGVIKSKSAEANGERPTHLFLVDPIRNTVEDSITAILGHLNCLWDLPRRFQFVEVFRGDDVKVVLVNIGDRMGCGRPIDVGDLGWMRWQPKRKGFVIG